MIVAIHPWTLCLWVVTVNGFMVSEPMRRRAAERLRARFALSVPKEQAR